MPDDVREPGAGQSQYSVRAVIRAVAILRAFTPGEGPIALSEIAHRAALDKATCRRLLMTLREAGLVDQNLVSQRYSLGIGVLEIASAVPPVSNLPELASDLLRSLAETTGATVFLSVRKGDKALCLGRFMADTAVQVRWWDIGGTRPMNCGGGPRLLLAYADEAEQDEIISAGLTRFTAKSELDPDRLREDLAKICARGWEIAVDDVYEGLSAIAVPFFDSAGTFVGAISLAGLTARLMDSEGTPLWLDELKSSAKLLSSRIRPDQDFIL